MAPRPDTWMPLYWGDYLRDTMHLKAEGHGAYLLLIAAYWIGGGPLPDDDEHLAAVARLDESAWLKLKPTLRKFFDVANGKWHHKRVGAEIERTSHIAKVRQAAGARGGKATANSVPNPVANAQQKPTPSQSHKNSKTKKERPPPTGGSPVCNVAVLRPAVGDLQSPSDFESWWNLWRVTGSKRGKRGAERAFLGVLKNGEATGSELAGGLERYMAHCEQSRTELRFIKHPATWLNQGCWSDEYPEPGKNETDVLQEIYAGYQQEEA